MTISLEIINADVMNGLSWIEDGSINCAVTSPPYWGLRDYGEDGQMGLEKTPEQYVENMVAVFREVKRVLRNDGTLWLNIGDSFYNNNGGGSSTMTTGNAKAVKQLGRFNKAIPHPSIKQKDLVGIPWMLAFALRADGWYLRSDIIWHKPNAMPESVTDRPTKAHEYLFLLSKSPKYYYDHEAVKEQAVDTKLTGRNRRSVWTVATKPLKEAHFATFPEDLVEPCILAGCPEGGTVLDPFCGAATTLLVTGKNNRNGIGIELNSEYCTISRHRIEKAGLNVLMYSTDGSEIA